MNALYVHSHKFTECVDDKLRVGFDGQIFLDSTSCHWQFECVNGMAFPFKNISNLALIALAFERTCLCKLGADLQSAKYWCVKKLWKSLSSTPCTVSAHSPGHKQNPFMPYISTNS